MSRDPLYFTKAIINRLHGTDAKKITYSSCGEYVKEAVERVWNLAENRGFEKGRERKSQVFRKGIEEGMKKNYLEVWQEAYLKGYEDGQRGL